MCDVGVLYELAAAGGCGPGFAEGARGSRGSSPPVKEPADAPMGEFITAGPANTHVMCM